MNNLTPNIEQKPAVISFNYEQFKAQLTEQLEKYRTVVTADTLKDAKETATELNKLKGELDTQRKEAIKFVSAPIKEADDQMKECIKLIESGRQEILGQVAKFDQARLDTCHDLLVQLRHAEREDVMVRPEFYKDAEDLQGLVKLSNLTAKDNLTADAQRKVRELVNAEYKMQQTVERRLLELENASYKAGLAAPLKQAHVDHILREDADTYATKLQAIMDAEIERDNESRGAIQRDTKRNQQMDLPTVEPVPEPESERQVEADVTTEQAATFLITCTMTARLPADMTAAEIERQFCEFIQGPGVAKVHYMTVEKEDKEQAA